MPETKELAIGKRKLRLTNVVKVPYPAGKFTKEQVIDYYVKVAPFLLPHFRNRPVTLKRFPDGPFGEAFYEKDAPAFTPDWVETHPVPRADSRQPPICYILINDAATLAWAANLAGPGLGETEARGAMQLHRVDNVWTAAARDLPRIARRQGPARGHT